MGDENADGQSVEHTSGTVTEIQSSKKLLELGVIFEDFKDLENSHDSQQAVKSRQTCESDQLVSIRGAVIILGVRLVKLKDTCWEGGC